MRSRAARAVDMVACVCLQGYLCPDKRDRLCKSVKEGSRCSFGAQIPL